MPFERYLHYTPDPEQGNQPSASQQPVPVYQDYSLPGSDGYHYDPSIFSTNVQFQMPQLILGPTLAPGGGAEVLPAGIVGRQSTIASNWLPDQSVGGNADDGWYLPPSSSSTLSQALVMPHYPAHHPSGTTSSAASSPIDQPSSTANSPIAASFASACVSSRYHAHYVPPQVQISHVRTALANPSSSFPVSLPFILPPVGGLPVYSSSGFDTLSILARVATRPHQKISLGPVDMTCAFTIVDVRRFDHPIVYASPSFCKLTGYSEAEILGHNCRFLQAPGGQVQKGEIRKHTAQDAVAHMRKSLVADKECQVSLLNYRKNGAAFINLVTVIPIPGGVHNASHETEDVVYQVGFQVDLTEQPNDILQKLRDGSYMSNYSNMSYPSSLHKDYKPPAASVAGVSKHFRTILNNQDFVNSIPISISTTTLSIAPDEKSDPYDGNRLLSLVLLETSPDFVVAMSLKGAFLYVSPSVTRVLGYDPEELVGKGVTDFCHEADKVPLIRELKESTAMPSGQAHTSSPEKQRQQSPQKDKDDSTDKPAPASMPPNPRSVDLLFRMLAKNGSYVWVECSGRLFAEPGKGRKAIILSGRVRNIPSLQWQTIARAGGFAAQDASSSTHPRKSTDRTECECWALLSEGGSILHAGTGVRDVLGWGVAEVIGRPIVDFVAGSARSQRRTSVRETLRRAFGDPSMESRKETCHLQRKDGSEILAELTFYHPHGDDALSSMARPLVCQIQLAQNPHARGEATMVHAATEDVFAELDTSRGSGWQYELQQLKHANQRLLEDVEELEAQVEQRQIPYRREVARASSAPHNAWEQHLMSVNTSSKRTWDGTAVTGSAGRT